MSSGHKRTIAIVVSFFALGLTLGAAIGQVAPSSEEISRYSGLHKAALAGDLVEVTKLLGNLSTACAAIELLDGK